ncbi:hypothetical protein [Pacificispira sp.]|uniref:hypothetical protein n=1 Tax=Pacificispira sp. TaxID=2888761 RepID=UPI003BA8C071
MSDKEKTCRNCKFWGWDPDGHYCAHPTVLKAHPYGLVLSSRKLLDYCRLPDSALWEKDPDDRIGRLQETLNRAQPANTEQTEISTQ